MMHLNEVFVGVIYGAGKGVVGGAEVAKDFGSSVEGDGVGVVAENVVCSSKHGCTG